MSQGTQDAVADLQLKIDRVARGNIRTGTVVAVDRGGQTCDVLVQSGDWQDVWMNLPIRGGYLPDIGHAVTLTQSGTQIAVDLPTQAVIAGIRTRVDSVGGDNLATKGGFETSPELCLNPGIEVDTLYWAAGANTGIARVTTPVHSGGGALQFTSTLLNSTSSATYSSFVCAQYRRYWFQAWVRTAVTVRAVSFSIVWKNTAGGTISTTTTASLGNDAAAYARFETFATAPAGAVTGTFTILIGAANVALSEIHYADDVSITEAVPDFDSGTSAKVYTFDGGTEAFTGTSATLAQYTGLNPAPIAGVGSLRVTSTVAASYTVNSPQGASGAPSSVGFIHAFSAWVRPAATVRTYTVTYRWWNGAAANGTAAGPVITGDVGQWLELSGRTPAAPAGTTNVSISIATSGGAVGEVFFVDIVLLTGPSNCNAYINTNATYVRTGTKSMAMKAIANGVANVLTPPGDDATYAYPVVPSDYYDVDIFYKNDAANGTRKALFVVASWYSAAGGYLGTQLGTYPITTPGAGFIPASETFIVPTLVTPVAFMRVNIVYLASAGDIVYVDDVSVRRNSVISGKFVPQGSIETVDMKYKVTAPGGSATIPAAAGIPAGPTWTALQTQSIVNPNQPVRVYASFMAYTVNTAAVVCTFRTGVSFDNGLSWNYGSLKKAFVDFNVFTMPTLLVDGHQVTGMPTDTILYRFEVQASAGGVLDIYNPAQWAEILPAPPAGRQ